MTWPQSDLEMMQLTLPQALAGEKPFHNYYMTVSGHMNYSFAGNAMSAKHRDEVADLDMSEAARAYLACNMELDQALEYTIKTLEEAGELENTVIVLSGDHYPYGLDGTGAIDELAGEGTEADPFEKYRSTLILWSGDMEEPVVVDKPCYSVDIIPTLSNLFGLEYDSRLLAGRDILSDAPGLSSLTITAISPNWGVTMRTRTPSPQMRGRRCRKTTPRTPTGRPGISAAIRRRSYSMTTTAKSGWSPRPVRRRTDQTQKGRASMRGASF